MSLCVWAPPRPHPAPAAGTLLGSMAAHSALLAVLVGGDGPVAARAGAAAPASVARRAHAGERLLWVGVGGGSGAELWPRRPGTPPPTAYVVPARGGPLDRASGGRGAAVRPPSYRPTPLRVRLPIPALPRVALPNEEVTLLVAGVLAAAPDLTRRVSRPEDFAPPPEWDAPAELGARAGARALVVVRQSVPLAGLPVPLVTNPLPSYPVALERAGVDGAVVVEFRIDSAGVVDLGSLRVVESTNGLFSQAVRRVLPDLRFFPAQLRERAVGVTVRQPFVFRMHAGR